MAYIVSTGERNWDQGTVREALLPKLAAYKIPKYIQTVNGLPKTATGKIRKQDLRSLAAKGGMPHDPGETIAHGYLTISDLATVAGRVD